MGVNAVRQGIRDSARKAFTVPGVSGNYAEERITFGRSAVGVEPFGMRKVTALAEQLPASATVELWACPVADASHAASDYADTDFVNTGFTALSAAGMIVWEVGMWACVQIRVKSGGPTGSATISASCY